MARTLLGDDGRCIQKRGDSCHKTAVAGQGFGLFGVPHKGHEREGWPCARAHTPVLPCILTKPSAKSEDSNNLGCHKYTHSMSLSTQKYVRTSKGSALSKPKVCKVTHTIYNALELDGEEHTEITFDRAILHPSTLRHLPS